MIRFARHAAPIALATLLAAPAPGWGQTAGVDEGAFRILINGREVGRETFSIHRSGSGANAVITAQGKVTGTKQDISSNLELTGSPLRPAAYQVEIQGDGTSKIAGRVVGGRFTARIASPSGEQMREYLAGDGAVVVDEGVAHQYYFVARRALDGATSIPILVPRQSRQIMAQISVDGSEAVDVGGTSVQAKRITIQPRNGDPRTIWADDQGRILKVEIPALGYTALRSAPPG